MKSPAYLWFLLLAIISVGPVHAADQLACLYKTTDSPLNVRAQPGREYKVLGVIPANTANVLHLKNHATAQPGPAHSVKLGDITWLYVKYQNIAGWASQKYLTEVSCDWTDNWETFSASKAAPTSKAARPADSASASEIFLKYNYKSSKLNTAQCLAQAKKALLDSGFQPGNTSKTTIVGSADDGYKGSIWCTPKGLVFFVVAGPDVDAVKKLEVKLRKSF